MMQIPQNAPKSSFGIPEGMREQMEQQKVEKEAKARLDGEEPSPGPEIAVDDGYSEENAPADQGPNLMKKIDPMNVLSELGIVMTDTDFHRLIFKGFLQKTVTVVESPTKPLTALFKTMTGEEYEEADELLAEDITSHKMTVEGRDTRQNMWHLAYGVPMLMGKELVAPIKGTGGNPDRRQAAVARKKVLNQMSPAVIRKLMQMYGRYTLAINMLVEDPDNPLFKEPSATPGGSVAAN